MGANDKLAAALHPDTGTGDVIKKLTALPNILDATQTFMERAGQLDTIGDFNENERHKWFMEEINEYYEAWNNVFHFDVSEEVKPEMINEVEMVDAILDMIVIGWGTLLQRYGAVGAKRLADEVSRSNLDKVGPNMIKREDGKVQKPEGWVGPQIGTVLAQLKKEAANGTEEVRK